MFTPLLTCQSMEKLKPSLNQISQALDLITSDRDLKERFDFNNEDTTGALWKILETITTKQYRFFLALLYNREAYKLIRILKDMGLKTKD